MREFFAIVMGFGTVEFRDWGWFCSFVMCIVGCDVLVGGTSSFVVAATVVVLGGLATAHSRGEFDSAADLSRASCVGVIDLSGTRWSDV
jgi:hypothetical protein